MPKCIDVDAPGMKRIMKSLFYIAAADVCGWLLTPALIELIQHLNLNCNQINLIYQKKNHFSQSNVCVDIFWHNFHQCGDVIQAFDLLLNKVSSLNTV